MSDLQVKLILYCAIFTSWLLAIVILLVPDDGVRRWQAVLCLFGTGLLTGMAWQVLICRRHDERRAEEK